MYNLNRRMDINDYKIVIKDMLYDVHKICVENNLHYCVAYGTLIGAVRHDGFIPWDDDIDIWMLGEDFQKFVELFTTCSSDYYILSSENSPYYYNLMTRLCSRKGILQLKGVPDIENLGPFIDVFPIYKAPEDYKSRMAFFEDIKNINSDIKYSLPLKYYKTQSFKGMVVSFLRCLKRVRKRWLVGTKQLKMIREELVKRYEKSDFNYFFAAFEKEPNQFLFERQDIEEVETHKFEDIEVFIPTAYDKILTSIYGEYMVPPPAEQRISRHHFIPYWKD